MTRDLRTSAGPIALFGLLLAAQSGCVALNIPSHRYHDPADHGGLFGSWRVAQPEPACHDCGSIKVGAAVGSSDCHDLGCDLVDGEPIDEFHEVIKPPEIPWPRFHPVPTRPVFGTPDFGTTASE